MPVLSATSNYLIIPLHICFVQNSNCCEASVEAFIFSKSLQAFSVLRLDLVLVSFNFTFIHHNAFNFALTVFKV